MTTKEKIKDILISVTTCSVIYEKGEYDRALDAAADRILQVAYGQEKSSMLGKFDAKELLYIVPSLGLLVYLIIRISM